MIAAQALSHQAMLITNNTRDFAQVPGLQVDNWVPAEPADLNSKTPPAPPHTL